MLIQRAPDTFEKLVILGGMAGDDVLSRSSDGARAPYSAPARRPIPGVYRAAMPNGKFISLMRVMFTDFCMMDCAYCPNSVYVPRKRFAFKVEELARAFMELHQRHAVAGLFLSSGIAGSGSKTTEKLIHVVEMIRRKHGFKGYIHLKVMPGTEYQYVEAAYRLGTRLSINVETPTAAMMQRISPHKDLERDILAPMGWIDGLTRSGEPGGAVGQVTQMVVGAADESDWDIFQRIDQLYGDWNLRRVYYSAFRPAQHTPLEEHPPTPMMREHRLYQMDWLKRVYRFPNEELKLAFDGGGGLSLDHDPKSMIAMERLDAFPVDLNVASREELLRVPGIGPTAAQRILQNRRQHAIDSWRHLEAMGVVRKHASPFIVFPGQRPPPGKQLKLQFFGETGQRVPARPPAVRGEPQAVRGELVEPRSPFSLPSAQPAAPCGQATSCLGCPMHGMPGHPGSPGYPSP